MAEDAAMEAVARALGYRFEQPQLLRDALTHRSFANEKPDLAPRDNERLEFLGDAVLELVASLLLWEAHPQAPEGELTRRRADLVCESGLAELATELGIPAAMRLGRGEEQSGGRDKPRLLSSALEACMGAVLLDGGPGLALDVGRRLFADRLSQKEPGARDYKSRAQEAAQANGLGAPHYEVLSTEGPAHDCHFVVALVVDERRIAEGHGQSKLEAEQDAARLALEKFALPGNVVDSSLSAEDADPSETPVSGSRSPLSS